MTRVAVAAVSLPATSYNLTDSADFETLATGSNNGVTITYSDINVLLLKNTTGGAAVFTIKVVVPAGYDRVTVSDETVSVAAGDTHLYPLAPIFRQSDGKIYIDCDVAGEVLALTNAT